MRVAIIPARGGSKRIKDKNIREFGGKPMIYWAISNAIRSELFDRVLVSTDSKKIKSIAIGCGAEVPFIRPSHLSGDHTGTAPVISHAIDWMEQQGGSVSEVCCIYPATPFLEPEELNKGLKFLLNYDIQFSFSITSYAHPIQRALRLHKNGMLDMFDEETSNVRSQDLEEMYHDAGQFYWATSNTWRSEVSILSNRSAGVFIPRYRAIDIDTHDDWTLAELIFEAANMRVDNYS